MSNTYKGGCIEALQAAGIDPTTVLHCDSCHYDEQFGYEMNEIDIGEDTFEVCCEVANAIHELKK